MHYYYNHQPATKTNPIINIPNPGTGPPIDVSAPDTTTAAAKLAFTNPGPQLTLTCMAAATYVLARLLARSLVPASNTAMVSFKHASHVG